MSFSSVKVSTIVAAAIVFAGSSTTLHAQADGLVAFPAIYKVQFENPWVRLVRVLVPGGAKLGMHSHPAGFMFHVYLNDADPIVFNHDGPPYEITRPSVTARSYRIGTATPEVHAVVNPSITHTDYLRVEYKTKGIESSRHRVAAPALGAASSTIVEHTGDVSRVTRVTIAPGASSEFVASATEPALLIVMTDGSLAEGSVSEGRTVYAGDERFIVAGTRSLIRNTGTAPLQILRFDFLTEPVESR